MNFSQLLTHPKKEIRQIVKIFQGKNIRLHHCWDYSDCWFDLKFTIRRHFWFDHRFRIILNRGRDLPIYLQKIAPCGIFHIYKSIHITKTKTFCTKYLQIEAKDLTKDLIPKLKQLCCITTKKDK